MDLASIQPGHEFFVIERILNEGDIPAIRWMWRTFPDDLIAHVIRNSRRLSRRAATFWALLYDIPHHEVRSLFQEADWPGVPPGNP